MRWMISILVALTAISIAAPAMAQCSTASNENGCFGACVDGPGYYPLITPEGIGVVNVRNEIEVERPTFPEISFAVERSYDLHENEIVDYPGDADEILDQWLTFLNLSYGPHLNITGPGVVNLSRIRNNSFFR